MYKDAVLKINYYKSQIMQELTKHGIYPDNITVQNRIQNIDNRLAIFQYINVQPKELFDVNKFNTDLIRILQDLKFLYELVYDTTINEYTQLKSYVDCHLTELEDLAKKYSYKTKLEISGTALGKTIFFQTNGYNLTMKDTWIVVALGSITANKGSKLACIFDADDIEPGNVIFSFDNNNCSPYGYNRDFFKIPGDLIVSTYNYETPEDSLISSAYPMNIANFIPTINNQYIIFGGKNKISFNDVTTKYIDKTHGTPCVFRNSGRIEFYVYNGSFINFDFSKQPISKNFSDTYINNLKKRHKIIIQCDTDFAFDFVTDGQIYAVRQNGIIKDDILYYPYATQIYDFFIEEFKPGDAVIYQDVTVTISNIDTSKPININAIAIKELSAMDVILE